ncbi:type 2 lantipeptide synthetase LanM family protein [Burkholderia sp. FERM BP-3421]|uniref:type 2 lanthipeptide synthetase LanM family protein n=1 Tax=Burkholderia sp. FERM BP-3421 TaxID=1494466 RepID=UPI002362BF90|nr:type 2 lanthipeptide synthetase LanM family protein [Burkholderia sp. FERM BP-3421]WDD92622.1 type 2 lantipeptide synthetase LanM family protein [Burkholderia sp. FERM BP-3421]
MTGPDTLRQLAARARSLPERLAFAAASGFSCPAADQPVAAARLARWRRAVAGDDAALFTRRLAWSGIAPATALAALAPGLPAPSTLPAWLATFGALQRAARAFVQDAPGVAPSPLASAPTPLGFALDPDDPLPFEALWLPALALAREQLRDALAPLRAASGGDLSDWFAPSAYLDAERALLRRVTDLAGRTLGLEFATDRPAHLNLPLPFLDEDPPDHWHRRFVALHCAQGYAALFDTYPVLARLIVTALEDWRDELVEFLHRLAADLDTLRRAAGGAPGPVTALRQDLSDAHHGGRAVKIVRFAQGGAVVYKPRSVAPEIAFNALLARCNALGATPAHATLDHLDRGAYGWALTCASARPCADRAALDRFYRRAGMLLCLAYALDANDLHSENLIAAGEHPVLVDTETLMHPRPAAAAQRAADPLDEDARAFADSVLRSGLLPRWSFDAEARIAYDISGLGRGASQPAPWQALGWSGVNTDRIALLPRDASLPAHDNLPSLAGRPATPADHVDALCAGFAAQYRLLARHRATLLDDAGWLATLHDLPVRFLLRPTEVYGAALEQAGLPQHLRDGVERSIELDRLSAPLVAAAEPGPLWPALDAETRALERLDIPYFGTTGGSQALEAGVDAPLPDAFDGTGVARVIERLRGLDETDLALQLALIRGSFLASSARHDHGASARSADADARGSLNRPAQAPAPASTGPAAAQLIAQAGALADELAGHALRDPRGRVTWLGLRYAAKARRFQFEPVGVNLYDGRCGIALFLAALAHARGDGGDPHAALLADTLAPVRRLFNDAAPAHGRALARRLGLGGASGLGSIVYALTRIARWRDDAALLDSARAAARGIDASLIAADDRLDVIDGAAGALLGLLALHEATGDAAVLRAAIACGDHLLARRHARPGFPPAWRTLGPIPLTGFSHGAAGIAYALQRLHAATARPDYRAAARDGIAYERACYDVRARNWPDYRMPDDPPGFALSWCHGAPGIGLARAAGLALDAGADAAGGEARAELDAALATTRAAGLPALDHLCCGGFGLVDTLLSAGLHPGRDAARDEAGRLAAQILARADTAGGFRLFGNLPASARNPGLFQGTAGIGYQMLRLAAPTRVPSVLLFE